MQIIADTKGNCMFYANSYPDMDYVGANSDGHDQYVQIGESYDVFKGCIDLDLVGNEEQQKTHVIDNIPQSFMQAPVGQKLDMLSGEENNTVMLHTKRCGVLNLPTEDTVNIFHDGKKMFHSFGLEPQTGHSINSSCKGRHVYIVSDGIEIAEGDWFYNSISKQIIKATHNSTALPIIYWHKVLASTDKSLGLPDIPKKFLTEYVAGNGGICKMDIDIMPIEDGETEYKLRLTDNNEVVVSHQKGYKYRNGHTFSEYKETLRHVAYAYIDDNYKEDNDSCILRDVFMAGAEWYRNNIDK